MVSVDIHAQHVTPRADRPVAAGADIESAIAPFVKMGKETYPSAKRRFLEGLPEGHVLYVVSDISDQAGRREQVFVRVKAIRDGTIEGAITSDVLLAAGHARGDEVSFSEALVNDWSIVGPDASEEGNFVGRFLDHYQPGKLFVAVFGLAVANGKAQRVRLALVADETGESLDLALPTPWLAEAAKTIGTRSWPRSAAASDKEEVFVPVIYDPERPDIVRFAQ